MPDHTPITRPWYLLPVIVISQLTGTAPWFATNAVLNGLIRDLSLPAYALGNLTSAVQLGFILGTLTFAFLLIADRFSPVRVFLFCAIIGALTNGSIVLLNGGLNQLLFLRFLTGISLSGIYPVGMKIASDWYRDGLGKALGYLVGALVLGKALPHFLQFSIGELGWKTVILSISAASLLGGLLLFALVQDGPFRKASQQFKPAVIRRMFQFPEFRAAAFGYFGHMWELYAFWAFLPYVLKFWFERAEVSANVSFWSFVVIGIGSLGCVVGGYISLRKKSKIVATYMLLTSGLLCLISPLLFHLHIPAVFLTVLGLWGFTVVGDSPQFSTMVAQQAPAEFRGSALTIVNCIGFAITIGSIQLLNYLSQHYSTAWLYLPLTIGPIFGLLALWQKPNQLNFS